MFYVSKDVPFFEAAIISSASLLVIRSVFTYFFSVAVDAIVFAIILFF
jgi:hypothetical protein